MPKRLVEDPPTWFIERDYSYTETLDPEGCLIAFFNRLAFDAIPESKEFFVSGESDAWEMHRSSYPNKKKLFEAYLERTKDPPGHFKQKIDFPALKEIQSSDEATTALSSSHLALVAVELDASEGTTIRQFTEWLERRKRENPYRTPSFVRPGKLALQTRFLTGDRLESWANQRVLQLWDLLFWKKLFNKKISEDNLGNWLFPEYVYANSDPREKFRYSKEKLEEAVKLVIPPLYEVRDWGKE